MSQKKTWMTLSPLGKRELRGEKAPRVKWKITSVRLARSDIDTDKHHESVNWQTILFFFFSSVGKNDRKHEELLLTLEEKGDLCSHFNRSRKSTSSFTRSTGRIWRPRFVLRSRVGSHADRRADCVCVCVFLEKTRKVTNDSQSKSCSTETTCGAAAGSGCRNERLAGKISQLHIKSQRLACSFLISDWASSPLYQAASQRLCTFSIYYYSHTHI